MTVQDAGGNTRTADTTSVTLAIGTNPGSGVLSCTANPKAAVAGVATFAGCRIDKVGTGYTLTASASGLTGDTSSAFNITVGAAVSLTLAAVTTTPAAGDTDDLTITAKDAGGNTATGYTGAKNLTFSGAAVAPDGTQPTVSNSSGATITFGSTTAITFTSGVASVSGSNNGVMKLYKAETASIVVSDGTIDNGAGLAVTVSALAASKLCIDSASACSGATDDRPKGSTYDSTVSLQDTYGNAATYGSAISVSVVWSGDASGSASLNIPAGQTTTSAPFSIGLPSGNNKDVSITASNTAPPTLTSATQTVHTVK